MPHSQDILDLLRREPGLQQCEIGRRLGMDKGHLSRVFGRMRMAHVVRAQGRGWGVA